MRRAFIYIVAIFIIGIALAQTGSRRARASASPVLESPEEMVITESEEVEKKDTATAEEDGYLPVNEDYVVLEEVDSNSQKRVKLTRVVRTQTDIADRVNFSASDSLLIIGDNNAYMYGSSEVSYLDLDLKANIIRMELDSNTVYAEGYIDSVGNITGKPVFADKSGSYESKTMKYNFKTERGYITDVVTEQDEGYLLGGQAKKMEDGTFNLTDGKYTTCDDHEHPHFYFNLTKAKVTPKKNIVSGPAYMVLADVPLPIALPFGYFPFSEKYSSGVIFPSFGEDYNRGFYARDGGYYFAINDNVDLALRGEIYTKGSWGINAHSSYKKRYKFSGNFDLSYLVSIYGDKGSPDYSKQTNFRVAWNHTQDPKANPNLTFSAAVNFATSGYTRNDINSYYSNAFTENTKSSTVNLTYRFPGSKWSVSATANITQRSQDSTLAVSFPNLTATMSQTAIFKRKKSVGGERWYEKIKLSYSGQFQNSLTAQQNEFFKKNLVKDWRNGMKHSVPVSATFSIFKYLNVSPNVTFNDRMYFQKIKRMWDPNASAEVQDTTYGFYNVFDFNVGISFDTKIYGFWKPLKAFGDKVQMIRHVMTPTVSFSYSPDFGDPFWGVYDAYTYVDQNGFPRTVNYSYFSGGYFGVPGRGKSGIVTVNLANNLEMKVKSDADSTGVKKVSLIENLTIGQSYNFAADSLRFSNINTSIMLRLFKGLNLNLSATWDPYMYGLTPSGSPVKLNKLRIGHGKGIGKLASTGTSFSYTFNNDTFRRKKKTDNSKNRNAEDEEENDDGEDFGSTNPPVIPRGGQQDEGGSDLDGYEKWSFPWSLTVNYSVNYGYGEFDYSALDYKGKWTQNLSFSGSVRPTKNWNFSFSCSYNFDTKKIAYMNCSISRDLHCFTMSASFVPVGPYKSYNFHIAIKSSMLKDIKYDKRSSTSNGVQWY